MKKRYTIWDIPVNRIVMLLMLDALSVVLSAYGAILCRFDFSIAETPTRYLDMTAWLLIPNILITYLVFWIWKLYKSVWRYASANELINLIGACVVCFLAQIAVSFLIGYRAGYRMPRTYYAVYPVLLLVCCALTRFSYRIGRLINAKRADLFHSGGKANAMIVGAGAAGNAILKEIEASRLVNMRARCFIDDNPRCHGKVLHGVPIVGGRELIPKAVQDYQIGEIIIAIPTAPKAEIREILNICKETGCRLRIVPGMYQLINGDVSVSALREVQIEDLLGRDPIKVNNDEILGYVKDKVILITGGGGSIGSELCRQIAAHHPARLIILDIYENSVYEIQQELKQEYPELDMVVLIASVRNTARINAIFDTYRPDIVYHAAAHKHVPLMEDSPGEAIKNNVLGTLKTATAAGEYGVKRFVLISTDKAVNPTNVMGASKRICEMIVQQLDKKYATEFVAVRFGNVLGSNGSVIPLFRSQIAHGGPVTVTHRDVIRYFMTIPEAVSLVLQAGAYAHGGEIFILDMGEPVKIYELAENLIKLSGLTPDVDIKIEITGLRPGEKLYEELLMNEEGMQDTANHLIHIGQPIEIDEEKFSAQLEKLKEAVRNEHSDIRAVVKEIVPTYQYSE